LSSKDQYSYKNSISGPLSVGTYGVGLTPATSKDTDCPDEKKKKKMFLNRVERPNARNEHGLKKGGQKKAQKEKFLFLPGGPVHAR